MSVKRDLVKHFTPILKERGFERTSETRVGFTGYSRTLRGYRHRIEFDVSRDGKGFRFILYAPKWPHFGWYSHMFAGAPMWWPVSPEDLEVKLRAAEGILLAQGLPWLDAYTPGNVPEWGDLVDQKVTRTMTELGFPRVQVGAWNLPDYVEYEASAGRVNVDLRVPGHITVEFVRYQEGRPTLDIIRSHPLAYEAPSLLEGALDEVQLYLRSHVPKWLQGDQRQD